MSAPSNVPHSALETAAPRLSRRERKKFAQRSRDSGDDGRVEAEQYSGEACNNDDSEMRRAAHELLRGIRAGALGRLLKLYKTSYRTVSAMSFIRGNATMLRAGEGEYVQRVLWRFRALRASGERCGLGCAV